MLYFASYFETQNHHGQGVSISLHPPRGYQDWQRLEFLAPSPQLLSDWEAELVDEAGYTKRYFAELHPKFEGQIKPWLFSLDPAIDLTLCCYEKSTAEGRKKFCHRNLVAQVVKKHRNEVFGGCDVRLTQALMSDRIQPETHADKRYIYAGTADNLKKQFAGVLLEIVGGHAGYPDCKGSNGSYYQSVPNLKEVPKRQWANYGSITTGLT